MSEKAPFNPEQQGELVAPKVEAAERPQRPERNLAKEHQEAIKPEEARGEVAKALEKQEKAKQKEQAEADRPAEKQAEKIKDHVVTPAAKRQAYKKTMSEVQTSLSPTSRAFSKVIHNPAVEATSEAVGRTVARPTSILYGSFCAFVLLSVVYLIAQRNGFRLSGFEFIGLFAIGWAFGILVDFLKNMITGGGR